MPPVIEVNNLCKGFSQLSWRALLSGRRPPRVEALCGVSLAVGEGEVLGLLGPNGAGKTTLIKILATLVSPDSGEARIAGYDLRSQAAKIRHCIGLVNTNERSFFWRLTGRQNLQFFARLYNLQGNSMQKRIDDLLGIVGLEEKADSRFMGWSTGQRQRLAIARALLSEPRVLLFDEPTASLDPLASAALIAFVKNELVGQGRTVIWCTHDLAEARQISDRVAILHRGRVLQCAPLDELQQGLVTARRHLLETGPIPEGLLASLGYPARLLRTAGEHQFFELEAGDDEIPHLLRALQNASIDVYACSAVEVGLETVFNTLVGEA